MSIKIGKKVHSHQPHSITNSSMSSTIHTELPEQKFLPESSIPFQPQNFSPSLNKFKIVFDEQAENDYSLPSRLTILKTSYYEIVQISLINSKEKKIAKILNRHIIKNSKKLRYQLQTELKLHNNLLASDCILKLERAFENKRHIWLVYENGENLPKKFRKLRQYFGEHEIARELLSDTMIGLSECNSFGVALGCLDPTMVVEIEDENYGKKFKIFNFEKRYFQR